MANEFFTDSNSSDINPIDFWVCHLGVGVIADAFGWAHQADPHAPLFYNDYDIAGEDGSNAKSDAVYAWCRPCSPKGYRSTASATRATSTRSTASPPRWPPTSGGTRTSG